MSAYSIIVIIIIAVLAVFALASAIKNKNKCPGCCENCGMNCHESKKQRLNRKKNK